MKLLEDVVITDSVEVGVPPEKVFDFFLQIVDDASYRAWHPIDHVTFRWIRGNPYEEGSVAYAEEYLHGKLHKLKFRISKIVPNREIEYVPLSRLVRFFFPKNRFEIKPSRDGCVFTAEVYLRIGRIARALAKRKLEMGLSSIRKHMKEEGENLKRILEERNSHVTNGSRQA